MGNKWHKNCGGVVMYQKPLEKGVSFEEAGFCKKCKEFPIVEENIIFDVGAPEGVERFYENDQKWKIVLKEDIPEVLESE